MGSPTQHFVVFHKQGESWPKEGLSFDHPIAQEHAKYFGKLHAEGVVIEGGPFPGNSGGMMVFKESVLADDAKKYASSDPAVKSGVMDFEIKPWVRVFK